MDPYLESTEDEDSMSKPPLIIGMLDNVELDNVELDNEDSKSKPSLIFGKLDNVDVELVEMNDNPAVDKLAVMVCDPWTFLSRRE
jgi:hypothetical protein